MGGLENLPFKDKKEKREKKEKKEKDVFPIDLNDQMPGMGNLDLNPSGTEAPLRPRKEKKEKKEKTIPTLPSFDLHGESFDPTALELMAAESTLASDVAS